MSGSGLSRADSQRRFPASTHRARLGPVQEGDVPPHAPSVRASTPQGGLRWPQGATALPERLRRRVGASFLDAVSAPRPAEDHPRTRRASSATTRIDVSGTVAAVHRRRLWSTTVEARHISRRHGPQFVKPTIRSTAAHVRARAGSATFAIRQRRARARLAHISPDAKLHLGCGSTYLPSWVNIDIDRSTNADVVHDLRLGLPTAPRIHRASTASTSLSTLTYLRVCDFSRTVASPSRVGVGFGSRCRICNT